MAYFKTLSKNLSAEKNKHNEKLVVKIGDVWDDTEPGILQITNFMELSPS
jgi:hypothetical protein